MPPAAGAWSPEIERLHLVPGFAAEIGQGNLVGLEIGAEGRGAALAVRDVILGVDADLIVPERPRLLRPGGAMLLDRFVHRLHDVGLELRVKWAAFGRFFGLARFAEKSHRAAGAGAAPIDMPKIGAHARRIGERDRADQTIDPEQAQRAEFVGQNGGIAMPDAVSRTAAQAGRSVAISADMADDAKQLGHGRGIGKGLLEALTPQARMAAEAVEQRREFGRDLLAECAGGKGKADRRAFRSGLGEFAKDLAVLGEFEIDGDVGQLGAGL